MTWPELRSGAHPARHDLHRAAGRSGRSDRPFGGVNPREIWLIAIVLAGVSFLGLCRGEVFRRAAWRAARGGGGRARVVDRGHASPMRGAPRPARARRAAGGRRGARDRGLVCARDRDRRGAQPSLLRSGRAAAGRRDCGRGRLRVRLGLLARGSDARRAHRGEIPQSVRFLVGGRFGAVLWA